ncbi:MAG: 3-dehydroquinate synthase [Actinobacteria bacterium ADurb.BinA094]|nr:MAG: 3-dehydroquinate synthase [Actinobacteria bacterium ADurb.BinA094]
MKRLTVRAASRSHPIMVGRGVLDELGAAVRKLRGAGRVVVLSDANVAPLYLGRARAGLEQAGLDVSEVVLPAGEREKSLARAEELYGVLYDRGLRRSDTLVALGGGVIGDLGGFVAATFQRGIGFVQAPTTLLAQVDASVGGKVAVDFRAGKNYVGTFYQPNLVVADLATLDTLPERELRSGAAEAAKHGLLAGGPVLRRVQQLARAPLVAGAVTQELVAGSIRYKAGVVERDEQESGLRAVLNLGHTIGHAIEAATGFRRLSHGEAVALGLRAALRLSRELARLPESDEAAGHALLDELGLPSRLDGVRAEEVCALIHRDKKARQDGVRYVLLRRLGFPVLGVRVPSELELEVVEWLRTR